MTVRIAMWSGPRNISTAMMRSFENRADCAVADEPFYAAYLAQTGLEHPMREAVLASQPQDWREVAARLVSEEPAPVFYQKHMTHHMLPEFGLDWTAACRSAFLIRDPAAVLASYVRKRAEVTLQDIGVVRQRELFDREADRLGHAPPVVDANDVLANPEAVLSQLCDALGIAWDPAMLNWAPGRRESDGAWAPHWYAAVEKSSGFGPPETDRVELPGEAQRLAEQCRRFYEELASHRIRPRQS